MPVNAVLAEDILTRGIAPVDADKLLRPMDGLNGADGRDGKDGRDGFDGQDGKDGRPGADGRPGKDGASISWRGSYDPNEDYSPNDLVFYLGSSYICVKESRNNPPNQSRTYWNLLAAAGTAGSNGRDGQDGSGSASLQWIDYVSNWSTTPSLLSTITDGDVYQYDYNNGTLYRLVPTVASGLKDSFYQTWDGMNLSNLVIEREMDI